MPNKYVLLPFGYIVRQNLNVDAFCQYADLTFIFSVNVSSKCAASNIQTQRFALSRLMFLRYDESAMFVILCDACRFECLRLCRLKCVP